MKINILFNAILVLTGSIFCRAQSLQTYIKSQNSFVPVSPEANQLMKYIDYPVNNFTGNANVEVPCLRLKAKEYKFLFPYPTMREEALKSMNWQVRLVSVGR